MTFHGDTMLKTPCLVPSFSSRGFPMTNQDGRSVSVVSEALQKTAEMLNDAMLVSAFDLYHSHLDDVGSYWSYPEILFVDSGGYETGVNDDLSDIASFPPSQKNWSADLYVQLLKRLPNTRRVVAVSCDMGTIGMPIRDQVAAAQALFDQIPNHISNLLIKPTTSSQRYLLIDSIVKEIDLLQPFNIIGVTEKELGNSITERMVALAKLRRAMDQASISAPIHVFGSLDPLLTPLYFVSGGEVFDGLAWLRYGFLDGIAVYRDAFVCKHLGPQCKRAHGRLQMLTHNLTELDRLRDQMRQYADTGNVDVFGERAADLIRNAERTVATCLGGV